MSKILVTGGAGFIGSHLCEELMGRGDEVWCVDNFLTGNRDNVASLAGHDRFHLIEADVSQPVEKYLPADVKVEQIFHLASPASPRGYQDNPIATYKVNAFGTHYLCEYACEIGAKIFFASTSEVYGDPLEHPQKETYNGNVAIRGVRSCYDESKRLGETIQTVWAREKDLNIRTIRIFNTYGPRMDPRDGRVFPNFITQAIKNEPITICGSGHQTRSFCFVTDLVRGILLIMDSDAARGKVFNVGSTQEETMLDAAHLIKKLCQSESEIIHIKDREDDPVRRKPDISLAKTVLGWEPKVGLEEGLVKTIEYFRTRLAQ